MKLRVYAYSGCDTCRKALKFLAGREVPHEVVPIREQPPTLQELRTTLSRVGDLRRLFNTSGQDYRAMNLKERLPNLSEDEALALLTRHGNLVKRPFALGRNAAAVGFKLEEWEQLVRQG